MQELQWSRAIVFNCGYSSESLQRLKNIYTRHSQALPSGDFGVIRLL